MYSLSLKDRLILLPKASLRLRINLGLRNSAADSSQRMLNAIEPGSVVPVHRHRGSSETLVVLRGRVVEEYYDSEGVCVATYELAAGGPAFGLNIPAGQWHSLRALDPGTVILEMKDGAYEPIGAEDVMER